MASYNPGQASRLQTRPITLTAQDMPLPKGGPGSSNSQNSLTQTRLWMPMRRGSQAVHPVSPHPGAHTTKPRPHPTAPSPRGQRPHPWDKEKWDLKRLHDREVAPNGPGEVGGKYLRLRAQVLNAGSSPRSRPAPTATCDREGATDPTRRRNRLSCAQTRSYGNLN